MGTPLDGSGAPSPAPSLMARLVVTPSPGASRDAQPSRCASLHDARGAEHRSRSRAFSRRAPRSSVAGMPLDSHVGLRMDSHQLIYRRSDPAAQGDSLKKLMLAGLVGVLGFAPAFALAQA